MTTGKTRKIHLCPVANLGLGMGPKNIAARCRYVEYDRRMGLALGTTLPSASPMQIIPTGGWAVEYLK